MTTKLIGIKEFRKNISSFTKQAKQHNVRYIILHRNIPTLEVKSIDEREFILEKFVSEVATAREQIKKGKVYSQNTLMKEFGLL